MAINSVVKNFLDNHREFSDVAHLMTSLDLRGNNLLRALGRESSFIPLPLDNTPREISKWIKGIQHQNPSVFKSLRGTRFVTDIESHLDLLKRNWLASDFMKNLKVQYPKAYIKIVSAYEAGDSFILRAMEKRKMYVDKHFTALKEAKAEREKRKVVLDSKTGLLDKLLSGNAYMSAVNIQRYLGGLSMAKLRGYHEVYAKGNMSYTEKELKAKQGEVQKFLDRVKDLPEPLQQFFSSKSMTDASSALNGILNMLPKDSFDKISRSSLFRELIRIKKLIGRTDYINTRLIETQESLRTGNIAPSQIRDTYVLKREISKALAQGNVNEIARIAGKLHPKRSASLVKELAKESEVLANLVLYGAKDPGRIRINKAQKAYEKELNAKALFDFRRDTAKVADAFLDKRIMDQMVAKGFDPKKYIQSRAGVEVLSLIGNELLDKKFMTANNILSKVKGNKVVQRLLNSTLSMEPKSFKSFIGKVISKEMKKDIAAFFDDWSQGDGKLLKEIMGADFQGKLIPNLREKYFQYAYESSLQTFVFKKVEQGVKLNADPFLINLGKNASFGKKMRAFGISSMADLYFKVRKELEQAGRGEGGRLAVSNYVHNLLSLSGLNVRLKNQGIFDMLEKLVEDNKASFELHVSGRKDFDTHPNEVYREDKRKSEPKRRREMDPNKRREKEAKEYKRIVLETARKKSSKVNHLEKLKESTLFKEGLERNPVLRQHRAAASLYYIQQGYSGKELEKKVEDLMRVFTKQLRFEVGSRINKLPEIKEARKSGILNKYGMRYDELRSLFTRQDEISRDPRNSAMNQERDRLAAEQAAYKTGVGMNSESMENQWASFSRMGRKGDFIGMRGRASIPTLIEEATTLEQLNEIRAHINDVIPLKYFRRVEELNLNAFSGYVVGTNPDGSNKTVRSLMEFMDFHATRIDPNWTTRVQEREGIIRTEGTTPVKSWDDLTRR